MYEESCYSLCSTLKNNIIFFVSEKPKGGIPEVFQPIAAKLAKERDMGRVIIFCHSYPDAISIHSYLITALINLVQNLKDHLTMLTIELRIYTPIALIHQ